MRGKHDACRVPHPSGLHVPSHGSPSVAAAPAMQRAHADICISQRKCACQCLLKSPKEGLSGRKLPCEQGRMSKGRRGSQACLRSASSMSQGKLVAASTITRGASPPPIPEGMPSTCSGTRHGKWPSVKTRAHTPACQRPRTHQAARSAAAPKCCSLPLPNPMHPPPTSSAPWHTHRQRHAHLKSPNPNHTLPLTHPNPTLPA